MNQWPLRYQWSESHIFFRPSFHYCLSSVHNCEDHFHIHVFIRSLNIWLSYIHSRLFTTSRVYLEPTQRWAPSWLVSSVGRALHRHRRDHWFKSRTGLNSFFRPYFHHCLSSVHNCEDRFHIHVFIRSSNIWLSYIHSRSKYNSWQLKNYCGFSIFF